MNYVRFVTNILKAIFNSFILGHLGKVCFHRFLLCLHLALGLYKHSQLLMKYGDRCHSMLLAFSKENNLCQHIHLKRIHTALISVPCFSSVTTRSSRFWFSCFFIHIYTMVLCSPFMCVGWVDVWHTVGVGVLDTRAFKNKVKACLFQVIRAVSFSVQPFSPRQV